VSSLTQAYLDVMFSLLDAAPGAHLHFGWWQDLERHERTFEAAQDAYADEVLAALGDVTGRTVLDVGAGAGGISRRLVAEGAKVVALCPRPQDAAAVAQLTGIEVHPRPFDAFESALRFDRVLFAESFGFVIKAEDTRRVIERCAQLLAPGGEVLIADMLPPAVVAELERSSLLSLVDMRDVTSRVAFTVEVLQARLDRRVRPYHRAILSALEAVEPALAARLDKVLAQVPNQALARVLSGRVVEDEMLRAMPYMFVRMRLS
jgi:2-polyprenyl-3-methyl-5-hydroxy-6-metoxy-1,4-benzoquinol methylase